MRRITVGFVVFIALQGVAVAASITPTAIVAAGFLSSGLESSFGH